VAETRTQANARGRFEQYTALPMLILALAFIPLLVIPFFVDLSASWEVTFLVLEWFIWAAFALEYLIRLYLAPKKLEFMRRNVIDLLVVVLPFLRPLRFLRFGRAVRLAVLLARTGKAARIVLTRHKLQYALLVALVVVIGAAALVVAVERGAPGQNIDSFAEALWWGVTTVTTVGYGDAYPVTAAGRGIAAVLMVLGIGIFGLLAASLAAYFVEQDTDAGHEDRLTDIQVRLGRIEQQLRDIENRATTSSHDVTDDVPSV
jgi:voltage-gated potassium channel